jgi:transposase-like protein
MSRGSNFKRPYRPEFRREAVELYRRSGRSSVEVARDLGVATESLGDSGSDRRGSTLASARG